MLKRILRRISRSLVKEDPFAWMADLDIGAGTRLMRENLDGMFPRLIHIGRNCVIGPSSMILSHDASYYLHTGEYRVAPVWIGDEVFIGYGAIIMPGVRIGSQVVIGAGSVVTKDVPDRSVAAGVPARVLCGLAEYLDRRSRFTMIEAPYPGRSPREITAQDVAAFRQMVYSMQFEDRGTC